MEAIVCEAYGPVGNLVLRELPEPVPGPGEIRLKISAVGVNFPDALLVRGLYQVKPDLPFVPGIECAGTIDALGEGVSGFAVGDRVAAMSPRFGTYAEAVVVPASHAYLLPASLEFTQAGGLLCAYGTAYHALVQRGSLQAGETLLVTGAAGGNGADVIFDPVGGELADTISRSVAWRGRWLVIGFAGGNIPQLPLNLPLVKGYSVVGVFWGNFCKKESDQARQNHQQLFELTTSGALQPQLHAVLPLAQAANALQQIEARTVCGKIVLTL